MMLCRRWKWKEKQGKEESSWLETYLRNQKCIVNITIHCQIYSLETESFVSDILEWMLDDLSIYYV